MKFSKPYNDLRELIAALEENGKLIPRDVSAETLLYETVKTVKRGSIVNTDRFKSYAALMFCGYRHLNVDHGKHSARGKVYFNGLEGFWGFDVCSDPQL